MQKILEILPKMVESLGLQKKYKAQLILFYWEKIVGADIAAQSAPVSIEYGVLFLSVRNSVWCHHLSMMKSDIAQKANAFVGEALVRDIRFKNHLFKDPPKCDEEKDEAKIQAQRLRKMRLTPENEARVENCVKNAKTEDVRRCFTRLYKKHLLLDQLKRQEKWHPCAECGVLCPQEQQFCSICALERRQEAMMKIRRALSDVPWATYAEINRYIPCTPQAYIDAKVTLLHRTAGEIGEGEENGMKAKMLTMLFTGANPEALSPRLIQKTLAKFRRNQYVSTSRR